MILLPLNFTVGIFLSVILGSILKTDFGLLNIIMTLRGRVQSMKLYNFITAANYCSI